jgi:fructoselysine-6-P-deglycase FrlB-like protein
MTTGIEPLAKVLTASLSLPILATGSGGSLTAAHFASWLHQRYAGRIAKAVTPLELVTSASSVKDVSVLMISAGGGNSDIIGAFKHTVAREPERLIVICSRTKSPLSRLAKSYRYVDLVDFDLPTGKDGFLATNSLVAFTVMLCRAWATALSIKIDLPEDIGFLTHPNSSSEEFFAKLADICSPLWRQETISVLYGPSAHSAAIDMESKFTEAALGAVQIADYRNFAHGRHHWLAKHGRTTGVLAFVTEDDREISNKTLRLIPSGIPVVRIDIPHGGLRAGLASLITVLYLTGVAGRARGIDPGRPGVPPFGSKIYRLSTFGSLPTAAESLSTIEAAAIERKTETGINILSGRGELDFWKKAFVTFTDRLQRGHYGAVVFDYDGTLCDGRDRYKGINDDVVPHLIRLLDSGVIIGIATGRGKSVREAFRSKIPESLWNRVLVGYYNGSDNGLLSDDLHPDSTDGSCDELGQVAEALESDAILAHLSDHISERTCRRRQITVQMKAFAPVALILDAVQQAVHKLNIPGVEVLCSSHSIDVIAPGVSKQTIVDQVREMVYDSKSFAVLCIGDRGQWPGNDFVLLNGPHSLSVDAVSPDPETCWNLAPPGHRGVQAALNYLRSLQLDEGTLKFAIPTNGHR